MADEAITYEQYSDKILIMGIGNLLLGDEGLGVHAIRELWNAKLPDAVKLLDAGTAFIDAVSHLEDIHTLIIIDAIKGGKKPGTVYRIQVTPDLCMSYSASMHDKSVIDMMRIAQYPLPDRVSVFGIEPEVIDWTMDISNTVSEAMPILIYAVLSEVNNSYESLEVMDTCYQSTFNKIRIFNK
ncbi:MAG: hydrogenase maturation protease [Proteobacteria bacterium]|nr:hydrogenase maturation protease [Pseudomonadota bacterium]